MRFVWDPTKKEKVAREHHIDFERIEDVFRDPLPSSLLMNLIRTMRLDLG
jgi:Uncharacterized protein conserved in bacteria